MTIKYKTIKEIKDMISSKEISNKEIVQEVYKLIKDNEHLNAFITLNEQKSIEKAEVLDKKASDLPLAGIPIAQKDLFCTKGLRTTCGSKILDNFVPPYSATVIENLENAGCISVGKTNMDEFAMGSSNETSYFGPVDNPWNKKLVPGGSSGGAAACVAANITSISTGTDTGGSIRQPAALCGITGLKPTYGLVSRWGMIAFCSSMDQAGPFSKDAFGCAALLDAMSSFDIKDSTCSQRKEINYERCLDEDTKSLKIGVIKNLESFGISDSVLKAYEASLTILESLGHKLIEVDFSELSSGICSYYVIAPAECSSNLSRFDGVKFGHRTNKQQDISELYMSTRAEGFGDEVKKRILIGTHVLSAGFYDAYYLKAQKVRRMIKNKFEEMYKDVDLIFMPTTLDQAFEKNRQSEDPNRMYKEDLLTIPANLAGLPAISFPNGFQNGLPTGGQLIGNYFQEDLLLQLTNKIQEVTDWHKMTP